MTCLAAVRSARLVVGLAALATGAVPAVVFAGADDGGSTVVVENAGDQASAITLPPPAAVGQSSQTTLRIDLNVALDGGGGATNAVPSIEMQLSSEVTEVAADGGYVALTTIDRVDVIGATEAAPATDIPCAGVTGVQVEQTFDARGKNTSTTPVVAELTTQEKACVDQLSSTASQVVVVYPDVPVGPGAVWSAELVTVNQGIEVPATYRYTLAEVADGRYVIDVTFDSDFDVEASGAQVVGNIAGTGSISGAVDNPLDSSVSLDVGMEVTSTVDGENLTLTIDMNIAILAAPGS